MKVEVSEAEDYKDHKRGLYGDDTVLVIDEWEVEQCQEEAEDYKDHKRGLYGDDNS